MRSLRAARGTVLIVALWITVALTGLALTLAFSMRTEAMAAANRVAMAEAEAAGRGIEQWLVALVDEEMATPGTMGGISAEARLVGGCMTWVVRPDYNDSGALAYGMIDEAAKVDLNTASREMLMGLPGMTEDAADAIVDWRDSDSAVSGQGAEDDYYMSLPEPYHCKNAPFESLEELLLVKGVTVEMLYGHDRNRNGVVEDAEAGGDGAAAGTTFAAMGETDAGIAPYVSVYGIQASAAAGTSGAGTTLVNVNNTNAQPLRELLTNTLSASRAEQIVTAANGRRPFANVFDFYFDVGLNVDEFTRIYPQLTAVAAAASSQPTPTPAAQVGKINLNTAPREVLRCLPGLSDTDADAIIIQRQGSSAADEPENIAWLAGIIDATKANAMGHLVTGRSNVYSGDVVALSPDGRAFRRSRVVVSAQSGAARIIYRRDLTPAGWPLPAEIRQAIRSGAGYGAPLTGGTWR